MDVVYNIVRQFFNKTSPYLYNELKIHWERQVLGHESIFDRNDLKTDEYLPKISKF